jgi:hypothetical protein
MLWRSLSKIVYSSAALFSEPSDRDPRPAGSACLRPQKENDWGARVMPDYKEFVDQISQSTEPSQVILNRSPQHAAVVIEFLFRRAREFVHIVANKLSPDVYCADGVIQAACEFIRTHRDGTIHILVENKIERDSHQLLVALDNIAPQRVTLGFIPPEVTTQYKFNLVVADGVSYRVEENRDLREAMIRFSDPKFGGRAEEAFQQLVRHSTLI